MIDDEDSCFMPSYEYAAIDRHDEYGEFESLAFVEVKGYMDKNKKHMTVFGKDILLL